MAGIVEKAARAMAEANEFCWENCAQSQWKFDVVTVLKAIREPTQEMCQAGQGWDGISRCYTRMIDAALAEHPEGA